MTLFPLLSEKKFLPRILWQFLVIVAIVYTAIEAPLSYVFDFRVKESSMWWEALISFIFTLDVVLNATGKLALKDEEIALFPRIQKEKKKYHKSFWLPIDLISAIPFEIIGATFGFPNTTKLIRLLRVIRIVRIFKTFKIFTSMALLPKGIKLSMILGGVFLILHWIACGWMLLYPDPSLDKMTFYNQSFYWALTTITTIGYGDITPTTNIGRVFTMFIMLTGVAFYGVIIGNVSRMIMLADRHKEANREKMNDLALFMKHYKIPLSLQKQVFGFYHHLITKRLSDNDTQIIGELPQGLQNELQIYMKMELIRSVPVFQGQKLSCLKMISERLKQSFHAHNKPVIKIGEEGNEMYIIGHGEVEVVVNEKTVATLKDGQHFGEIALLEKTIRTADVIAKTYCDLYILEKDDFIDIVDKFPELKESMMALYKRRKNDKNKVRNITKKIAKIKKAS
jgi:hypothetical protein